MVLISKASLVFFIGKGYLHSISFNVLKSLGYLPFGKDERHFLIAKGVEPTTTGLHVTYYTYLSIQLFTEGIISKFHSKQLQKWQGRDI